MAKVAEKLILAKQFLLGLSTQMKILVSVGVLLVVSGGTVAAIVMSNSNNPNPSTTRDESDKRELNSLPALTGADDEAPSATSDNDTNSDDSQSVTNSEQAQLHITKQPTSSASQDTSSTEKPGSGDTKPKSSSASAVPNPDYNLNDGWYLAELFEGGPVNLCWPEPFIEDESQGCWGVHLDFNEIGVAKAESAAANIARGLVDQKIAEAHVEPKLGASGVFPLTEALCVQYQLSCGRW